AAKEKRIPLQVCSMGGMFGFFFSEKDVHNYQDALQCNTKHFTIFFKEVLRQGVYLAPSPFESLFLSTSHTDEDLEKTAEAFRKGLGAI
ncbi:MAG TPA: aspartate aminotransferase family protein, partial [Deltaproteobacteria bacterium]|nr:aspartate aminotransferase family protein [Deltaproteobacteria bacterium]